MKIRLDFVTNSSSSSFVAYAVYSEELWTFIKELIDNGELANKNKGWGEYYGLTACSYLWQIDDGVSIIAQLGELGSDDNRRFNIFRYYEEPDGRSVREIIEDNENARTLGYLHSAVSHFFDCLTPASLKQLYKEKDVQLDTILSKALSENKVRVRTFVDYTDGFVGKEAFHGYEPPVEFWIDKSTLVKYLEQPGCKSAMVPTSVRSIGKNAFRDCDSLGQIRIPDSVKSIGNNAFQGCSSLKLIELPDTITTVPDNAFRDCKKLETVSLPASVRSIGDRAFMNCIELKEIRAEGLTSIGKDVFKNCKSLSVLPAIKQQTQEMDAELLKDKIIVHTGFSKADEKRIEDAVYLCGGIIKSSVVLKTDILLYNPYYDHETTKLKRAKQLNSEGKDIKILTYDEFLKLIENGSVTTEENQNEPQDIQVQFSTITHVYSQVIESIPENVSAQSFSSNHISIIGNGEDARLLREFFTNNSIKTADTYSEGTTWRYLALENPNGSDEKEAYRNALINKESGIDIEVLKVTTLLEHRDILQEVIDDWKRIQIEKESIKHSEKSSESEIDNYNTNIQTLAGDSSKLISEIKASLAQGRIARITCYKEYGKAEKRALIALAKKLSSVGKVKSGPKDDLYNIVMIIEPKQE